MGTLADPALGRHRLGRPVPSPDPAGRSLNGLAATSGDRTSAVGYTSSGSPPTIIISWNAPWSSPTPGLRRRQPTPIQTPVPHRTPRTTILARKRQPVFRSGCRPERRLGGRLSRGPSASAIRSRLCTEAAGPYVYASPAQGANVRFCRWSCESGIEESNPAKSCGGPGRVGSM
jgi:hypothetical protein